MLSEYSPEECLSVRAVHQYVPAAVSVYWLKARNLSGTSNTAREVQKRHTACPSMAPVWSAGKFTPSFS